MKKLLKLGLFAAVAAAVFKVAATKQREWSGLTEDEVRAKLDDKLGSKVPADKLQHIGDNVVAAMDAKGKLRHHDEEE